MKYPKIIFVVILAALLLAACSPTKAPVKYSMGQSTSTGCSTSEAGKTGPCKVNGATDPTVVPTQAVGPQPDLSKSDAQGSVTVAVKPLNLDKPGDTLVFDVSMNTHSVDLSMDLATLATLTTDNGQTVQGIQWNGPKGGHHVEGKLTFPATYDGKPLLEGARELTLTIKNVDAPTRLFTWQLTK
jgi:hypothetical protein